MMYRIGEFSKLCRLSVKTLRYYADIGLLEPEKIDYFTGYRYYSVRQLQDVSRIQALKDMGFSLEEIRCHKKDTCKLLNEKEEEIRKQIRLLQEKLKKLQTSENLLKREDFTMFHINIKKQEPVKVHAVRKIFANRNEALKLLKKQRNEMQISNIKNEKHNVYGLLVNYENEFVTENMDLEVAVLSSKGERELFGGIKIGDYQTETPQLVASIVCEREKLDDAYGFLIQYLKEEMEYQIVGDAHEWYLDSDMVELQLPIYKLQEFHDTPVCDEIDVPFVNDEELIGHWRTIQCPITKEGFHPGHGSWKPEEGDINELYFLPKGERYWILSWTKGYMLSRFGVPTMQGKNPYEIEKIGGKTYLFLWFKDSACFHRGALPTLLVLEKLDSKYYTKDEIRLQDQMTYDFCEDTSVLGKWKVCDFVRNPEMYQPGEYHAGFPKEKLYFKWAWFGQDGKCKVKYGDEILENPDVDWTKGYIRNQKGKLMKEYRRLILDEKEYLFIQFKSGDYYYNHVTPWWYVFTRAVEES